jgi:hypothetical protein
MREPSPEAVYVADQAVFAALAHCGERLIDLADDLIEVTRREDKGEAAVRLRQIVAVVRAACEVAGRVIGEAAE